MSSSQVGSPKISLELSSAPGILMTRVRLVRLVLNGWGIFLFCVLDIFDQLLTVLDHLLGSTFLNFHRLMIVDKAVMN